MKADHDVISVVGPAGVGKTELVAACIPPEAMWVRLAEDPSSLLDQAANIIEFGEPNVRRLLVLDGFNSANIEQLHQLPAAANLRLVVTSRRPLPIKGAAELRLSPLQLPTRAAAIAVRPDDYPSVQVFLDAAALADPTFVLDADTAQGVLRLLQSSGGVPAAIEHVASWLSLLHLDDLAARSPTQLLLVRQPDGSGTGSEVINLIRIALDHLAHEPTALAAAIAQFTAPCRLSDVEFVADNTIDLGDLAVLANTALITTDLTSSGTTLSMQPIVRTEVQARINDLDPHQAATLAKRHGQWFEALVNEHGPLLGGDRTPVALALLGPHADTATDLATTLEDDALANVTLALEPYLALTGQFAESKRRASAALDRLGGSHWAAPWLTLIEAAASRDLGDLATAHKLGLRVFQTHETDPNLQAGAAIELVTIDRLRGTEPPGDVSAHVALLDPATLASEHHSWAVVRQMERYGLRLQSYRGWALLASGDAEAAAAVCKDAIRQVDETQLVDLVWFYFLLAQASRMLGNLEDEESAMRDCVDVCSTLNIPGVERAYATCAYSLLLARRGARTEARKAAEEAILLIEEYGRTFDIVQTCRIAGLALAEAGSAERARNAFRRCLALAQKMDEPEQTAELFGALAVTAPPVGPGAEQRAVLARQAKQVVPDVLDPAFGPWLTRAEAIDERTAGASTFDDALKLATDLVALQSHERWTGNLSKRETEVLELLAEDLSDREIADRLTIGVRTVHTHVSAILRKLGVSNRREAAAWVRGRGDQR